MRKILFFIPTIIFTVFYLWISIWTGVASIDWSVAIPITIPFIVAGLLLCKNIFWGGLVGILPAIYLISLGKQSYTGMELPIGIIIFAYYIICYFVVYKKKSNHK